MKTICFCVLLIMVFIRTSIAAPLPSLDEIWIKADQKKWGAALSDIHRLKQLPASVRPELIFLEALIAFHASYFGKMLLLKKEYEKKYIQPLTSFPDKEKRIISLLWVRLTLLAYEVCRKTLFQDGTEALKISLPPSQITSGEKGEIIRFPITSGGSARSEIWADELESIAVKELREIKEQFANEKFKDISSRLLSTLGSLLDEGLRPYHEKILKPDPLFDELSIRKLDLKWDFSNGNRKKIDLLELLNAYLHLFKNLHSVSLRAPLYLRLGILNCHLGKEKEALNQLLSFVTIQGDSIWSSIARLYIGEIWLKRGKYEKAIESFLKCEQKTKTIFDAYLLYKLGLAHALLGKHQKAAALTSELWKNEWEKNDAEKSSLIMEWQDDLLKRMAFYFAKLDAKDLKKNIGEKSYPRAIFLISDAEKKEGRYEKAYRVLHYLEGESLSKEEEIQREQKSIEISLALKSGEKLFSHSKRLVSLYPVGENERELEEILFRSSLSLEKYYLEKKKKDDLSALRNLLTFYFSRFGQKGALSPKMVRLATPYLKLWEEK